MKMYGWILAAGMMGAAACDEGQGASGLSMTEGQLVEQLAAGSVRLEVELNADGTVREVEVEDRLGESTQVEDRVVGFDATTQRLTLSLLGEVDAGAAGRYRDDDGEVLQADWLAKVEAAIALGEPVWLDARGSYVDGVFLANELRVDNDDNSIEIEADVTAADYDATTGVLTIGGKSYDISAAAIREGTDDDANDDLPGDDNGGDRDDSVSDDLPGDDNGGDRDDSVSDDLPGDDNGGDRDDSDSDDLPGDDNGGDRDDSDDLPGDDNGGDRDDSDSDDLPGDDNNGSDDDNGGSNDDSNDDNSGSDDSGSDDGGSDDSDTSGSDDASSGDDDSESGHDDFDDSDDSNDDSNDD